MDARSPLPDAPRILPGCELYGYRSLARETSYWIDPSDIVGELPGDIEGTLFLSCVGRNTVGGQQFGHWFDGDGAVNAVTLRDGRMHFRTRFVRTKKFNRESAAQRILYRGVGTQIPGGMWRNMFRVPGNAANTNVILQGKKLLALWEGGKPWELDPGTLETVGEYNYDGGLGATQTFSAHPRRDPRTGDLYNFGVFGIPRPRLHFYRMNAEGKLLANRSQYVGDYAMCHDFVLTARHAVFVLCPAFMRRPLQFLFGRTSIMGAIDFDPREKTKIIVLDLATADIVREFEFDAFFGFHHGNGYEDGNVIHLDVLCVDDMDVMEGLSDVFMERDDNFDFLANGARLVRFSLDLDSGSTTTTPATWSPSCTTTSA